MKQRKKHVLSQVLSLLVFAGGSVGLTPTALAVTKIRLATPASPGSIWGQTFKTWQKAVEARTKGAATLEFFFNSTQGSDATLVDKLKAGQLDGASLGSVGLGRIDKRLLVAQLPGVIRSWKSLDAVRTAVAPDLEKILAERRITLVSWGDIGQAHFLSKGFSVRVPKDLEGHSPWSMAGDPVAKAIYGHLPKVNPFPAEIMGVLPGIESGKIDCMTIPALAAEMLQISTKFDHGTERVSAIAVGALVLSTDTLDKLPADIKNAVLESGRAMSSSSVGLKQRIRDEDAAAWLRFKGRTSVVITTPTDAETEQWRPILKAAISGLRGPVLDPALVDRVIAAAAANP